MNIESAINNLISINNYSIKTATPAVVVNTDELKDGFIDVLPLVNYTNPYNGSHSSRSVLKHIRVVFP